MFGGPPERGRGQRVAPESIVWAKRRRESAARASVREVADCTRRRSHICHVPQHYIVIASLFPSRSFFLRFLVQPGPLLRLPLPLPPHRHHPPD